MHARRDACLGLHSFLGAIRPWIAGLEARAYAPGMAPGEHVGLVRPKDLSMQSDVVDAGGVRYRDWSARSDGSNEGKVLQVRQQGQAVRVRAVQL